MNSDYSGKTIGGCSLIRQIGQGGGGLIFLAGHPEFGDQVVLKVLEKGTVSDEQTRLRFEREIRMSVELAHQNIVQVFQASSDEAYYYLIMEFVDGSDVEKLIETRGVFDYRTAANIVLQVAGALDFAHRKQIIHRDIKPSNILLDREGNAKLCDFGLAKDLKQDSGLTSAGMVLGTPNFMSPEQWFGAKDLTSQSDLFSLGATFFYMITGSKPFEGEDASTIMSNSLFGEPPPVRRFVKNVPAPISGVIRTMMARDLEERYAKASDVCMDLRNALEKTSKGFFRRLFGGD
jgi:serine/threonine-protein kinase